MKSLAIEEGLSKVTFKNYLLNTLNTLDLKFDYLNLNDSQKIYIDYVILNSIKEDTYAQISTEYCFVNMDNGFNNNINVSGTMITYGLGSKNTVTISSLEEDNTSFVYCLQRYVDLSNKNILEPQEIPIHLNFQSDNELYALMISITIGLIEGLNIGQIEKKLSKKVLVLR